MLINPTSRDIGGELYILLYQLNRNFLCLIHHRLRQFWLMLARDQSRAVKAKCPTAMVRRIHIEWLVEFDFERWNASTLHLVWDKNSQISGSELFNSSTVFFFLVSFFLQHPESPSYFLAFTENCLFPEGLMHPDHVSLFSSNASIAVVRNWSRSIGQ